MERRADGDRIHTGDEISGHAPSTRKTLVDAALMILEQQGAAHFSTRAVCASAHVTAPTLYHHFGSADGLLNAAVHEAFRQFLVDKKRVLVNQKRTSDRKDPETALREGWDDYVRFASDRPLLYAAMMARLLHGVEIPAARESFAIVVEQLSTLEGAGRLRLPLEQATQLAWASVASAALLYVSAAMHVSEYLGVPEPSVIESLRERTLGAICTPLSTPAH